MKKLNLPFSLLIIFSLCGCVKGQIEESLVYFNDFEDGFAGFHLQNVSSNYSDERIEFFYNSNVLGRFGFGGLDIIINGVPQYDFIEVSFDLYIHDRWEGNGTAENNLQPDIFIFNIDNQNILYSTFVNTMCQERTCDSQQSYPQQFGNLNPENADAMLTNLPGVCEFEDKIGGSKKNFYRKRFNQGSDEIKLTLAAQLTRVNTEEFCLKSWSIDNLKVVGINIPEIQ
jgi:hypothetical protein